MKYILILLFTLVSNSIICQITEDKSWCKINCDPKIDKENTKLIYSQILNDSLIGVLSTYKSLNFPIRFVFVKDEDIVISKELTAELEGIVSDLNYAFRNTRLNFHIDEIVGLKSDLKIDDLSNNRYKLYDTFSHENDLDSMITVYVMDHKHEFCQVSETSIRCSRTGGFSYILSSLTNNIVISEFDLRNSKIVAHEFGHFFGLYHTFEEHLFGKGTFDAKDCNTTGDLICDTPPDPGTVYEIYVNYSKCEMYGFDDKDGNEYKPILQNYMSYYKPCYLKENLFTKQQEWIMMLASRLAIRKKLSR